MPSGRTLSPRFGIGEWYGRDFARVSDDERFRLAEHSLASRDERTLLGDRLCPFRSDKQIVCNKEGGVCSLRLYAPSDAAGSHVAPVAGDRGQLRATCPNRFYESDTVFSWVGQEILDDTDPTMIGEVGFLDSHSTLDSPGDTPAGRIDMILATERKQQILDWLALEIQAVYFSGSKMGLEFKRILESGGQPLFPSASRRPDYRSSAPKRLMPQLQIKVPTLRRWGKKMAVVVDSAFFDSLGPITDVNDLSNADVAWFVVEFSPVPDSATNQIKIGQVHFSTLESAVIGLTGGAPVSLDKFERRISAKIAAQT